MLILDLSIKYEVYEIQNYRPLSILSNLSKVYEKCQFNEMDITLTIFCQNISVGSEKDSALNSF